MNFDNINNCEYEPTGINAQFGYNTPNMMNNNGCNCKARDELGEKILSDKYQRVYGPLSIYCPCNSWRWLENPWPWERSED